MLRNSLKHPLEPSSSLSGVKRREFIWEEVFRPFLLFLSLISEQSLNHLWMPLLSPRGAALPFFFSEKLTREEVQRSVKSAE